MQVDVVTIFPEMFPAVLGSSILKRAIAKGRVRVSVHDLRRWSQDRHKKVDDRPYGGGPGMLMRPEPFFDAVEELKESGVRSREEATQTALPSFSSAASAKFVPTLPLRTQRRRGPRSGLPGRGNHAVPKNGLETPLAGKFQRAR